MKEEQAHAEHKPASGLSGALKKVKAKFHSEAPKPKPKSPYTRDMKLADTVFAYRVLAGRSTPLPPFTMPGRQTLVSTLTHGAETRM